MSRPHEQQQLGAMALWLWLAAHLAHGWSGCMRNGVVRVALPDYWPCGCHVTFAAIDSATVHSHILKATVHESGEQ